jgi:predicted phage-related endonuclease
MKEYMRLADTKMGSSFDFSIDGDTPGILEIKNVDSMAFKNSWMQHEDGTIDAPPHIEIQLQHQFAVSGRTWGFIAALVGGNTIYLLKRQADPDIIQRIKLKATKFWESVESNTPPEPDYHKDAEFICSLYSLANPGKVLTASPSLAELVEQYKMVSDKLKILDEEKTAIKAQILVEIGDAEKVLGDNFTISAGVVGPAKISYERKGYRSFKVNFKKTKGDE